MSDELLNVDKPKEPRFVAIAGDLYEIDDIIDALHGRSFTATLHAFDLHELGEGAGNPRAIRIAQGQKKPRWKESWPSPRMDSETISPIAPLF